MRAALAFGLALAVAPAARADVTSAKPHVERGVAAYQAADYETASREFEAAFGLDPDPRSLYAWAQAQRLGGHCARALELYRQYLTTHPTADNDAAARTGISLCEQQLRDQPVVEPVVERPRPPVTEPPYPPWYRDRLGNALVISGVAAIAIGGTFLVLGNREQDAAASAPTRDEFLAHLDSAGVRGTVGVTAAGIGGALVIGGIVRYATRGRPSPVTVGVAGSSVTVLGRF
ncbi:MAG TPA: tetratricopeptide repeat protein [Kofleriaceae bacterium]|nr:tetratricopeptide repeat protein [Kofleriaceae bacterium]